MIKQYVYNIILYMFVIQIYFTVNVHLTFCTLGTGTRYVCTHHYSCYQPVLYYVYYYIFIYAAPANNIHVILLYTAVTRIIQIVFN